MNLAAINANAINASAFTVWQASANASIALVATPKATVAKKAASAALIKIMPTGRGTLAKKATADAVISLLGQGGTANVQKADAGAIIALTADGEIDTITSSFGDATINIVGLWSIPSTQPTTDAQAPSTRTMKAGYDVRVVKVPEELPLPIKERRGMSVQHEGRQA